MYQEIASYLFSNPQFSKDAYETAKLCLMDALGCAALARNEKEAAKLLGDNEAFNWGLLIRWLDYNDTWLAKEWGHPSDNIGTLLALGKQLTMKELLTWIIRVYEIQGVLALSLSCNQSGYDHVYFVKIASCAVAACLLGCDEKQVEWAISQAFIDGAPLRVYRHGENTGSRKSWAAGDAAARGVRLAELTQLGEKGYLNSINVPKWGVQEVLFKHQKMELIRPLSDDVIRHILFKVLYPAEFHAQTAIEAAIHLHPEAVSRLDEIETIEITTHDSAIRIIDKKGPLRNPADRDHCLQYMVAVALMKGSLSVQDYEEPFALDPRIDELRNKMRVAESEEFSRDYHHEEKRSIASSLQIVYKDGSRSALVAIEYPVGHPKRREEAVPLLKKKFQKNLSSYYPPSKVEEIEQFFKAEDFESRTVSDLLKMLSFIIS